MGNGIMPNLNAMTQDDPSRSMATENDADLLTLIGMAKEAPTEANEAFIEFHRRHAAFLYAAFGFRYGKRLPIYYSIADLVGDTLVRAWERAETYDANLEEIDDRELEQIMTNAGFDPLDVAGETQHNAVLAINGGMAHIYVKNRAVNTWSTLPRFVEDVRAMAERFYNNNSGELSDDPEGYYVGAFDLILVRNPADGFSGPYQVLVKQGSTFSTITLSQAVANGIVDPAYVNFDTNIQRLQNVRSGDVILLSSRMCRNDATGYYFGAALPGWHGSLCATDMTIPIIFSFPQGSGSALMRFEGIVDSSLPQPPNEARITNIEPTIYDLLTLEVP